jgi:hypothetical protein
VSVDKKRDQETPQVEGEPDAPERTPVGRQRATRSLHSTAREAKEVLGADGVRQVIDQALATEPSTMTQNKLGQWVPAIPMPFLGTRKKCHCGEKFWTLDGYRGHYALKHILDPEVPSEC